MTDLNLNIAPRPGRRTKEIEAEVVRPLENADVAMLAGEDGTKAPPLQRLSDRHHRLARAIASGMGDGEAAVVCGYSISRVSILKADPTFQELVGFYGEQVDAQFRDLHERLAGLSLDAAEILSERMEEDPDAITTGQAIELVKTGADRTGHGPSSTSTQLNVNVNLADRLEKARKRVSEHRTIEGHANPKDGEEPAEAQAERNRNGDDRS